MNSIFIVLLLTCIVLAFADPWDDYKRKYGKSFRDSQEEHQRYSKLFKTAFQQQFCMALY